MVYMKALIIIMYKTSESNPLRFLQAPLKLISIGLISNSQSKLPTSNINGLKYWSSERAYLWVEFLISSLFCSFINRAKCNTKFKKDKKVKLRNNMPLNFKLYPIRIEQVLLIMDK